MKESDIIYEKGDYFVIKAKHGYEVYKNGLTHSTRCAIMGYEQREVGIEKCIAEIDRRIPVDKAKEWWSSLSINEQIVLKLKHLGEHFPNCSVYTKVGSNIVKIWKGEGQP